MGDNGVDLNNLSLFFDMSVSRFISNIIPRIAPDPFLPERPIFPWSGVAQVFALPEWGGKWWVGK